MEAQIYTHTCNSCGTEKEIILMPNEKPEDLDGCVCNRTVDKVKFVDANSLMNSIKKK